MGAIVVLALVLLVLALLASRLPLLRRREGFSLAPPSLAGRSRVATGMDDAATAAAAAAPAVCFC